MDVSALKSVVKETDLAEFLILRGHDVRQHKMVCPFCGSGTGAHKSPAFHIFPDNRYKCFSCQASGDIITFVMNSCGLDFLSAILFIARELGIPLPVLTGMGEMKVIKIRTGSRLEYDQKRNSIADVPQFRSFFSREVAEIYIKKRELDRDERLLVALASMAMVLAEGDEDLDLIVGTMGDEFERRFYSLMSDKRWAFQKIIEWRNKLLNQRRQNEKK